MPTLLRNGRVEADEWHYAGAEGELPAGARTVVPWPRWLEVSLLGGTHGVAVPGDQEPETLAPYLDRIPLIAIDFPAMNDGRGLSLAVLLRTRFGYRGEIRAVGVVHEDLTRYFLRCGFDSLLLPEGRDVATALAAFTLGDRYYQGSVVEPQPAFRRVRRGT